MSFAGLSHMTDGRVVGSKARQGVWILLEGTRKLMEGCGQGGLTLLAALCGCGVRGWEGRSGSS